MTNLTADTFSLDGSTGNGAYGGGGVWNITGAYAVTITVLGADGYELGENYFVLFAYDISSTAGSILDSFIVN